MGERRRTPPWFFRGQAESSVDEIHKHNPVFLISRALCTFFFFLNVQWLVFIISFFLLFIFLAQRLFKAFKKKCGKVQKPEEKGIF